MPDERERGYPIVALDIQLAFVDPRFAVWVRSPESFLHRRFDV